MKPSDVIDLSALPGVAGAAVGTYLWPGAGSIDVAIVDGALALLNDEKGDVQAVIANMTELLKAAYPEGGYWEIMERYAQGHYHAAVVERLDGRGTAFGVTMYVFDVNRSRWYVRGRYGRTRAGVPRTSEVEPFRSVNEADLLASSLMDALARTRRPYRAAGLKTAPVVGFPESAISLDRILRAQNSTAAGAIRAAKVQAQVAAALAEREARVRASLARTPVRSLLSVRG